MKKLYISRINLVGSLRIRFFKLLSSIVNNIDSIKTKEQKKQNQHNSLLKVFANNDNSIDINPLIFYYEFYLCHEKVNDKEFSREVSKPRRE